jgi:hypothetical protein
MVDQSAYPVLFGTTQASWAPIDLRFELLTGETDPDRVARVYVVPFIGAVCVVVGFQHGDWGPVGGGREPGESVRAALERELLAGKGRAWEADLYRLAANRRAADLGPS